MLYQSPAKINFGLSIGKIRDDGYHELSTIFLPVSFYDTLSLSLDDSQEIKIACNWTEIPLDSTNLCYKAADSFFRHAGLHQGIMISIQKSIPAGAGLGGGSSNAATVLRFLDNEFPGKVSRSDLHAVAANIGADVPFFLNPVPSHAGGIGEILKPVDVSWLKDCTVLLVMQEYEICTPDAYGAFDMMNTVTEQVNYKSIIASVDAISKAKKYIINDFEEALFPHYPDLQEIKKILYDTGASFASMSGSGAAMYGIYTSEVAALKAHEGLGSRYKTVPAKVVFGV